MELVDRNYSLTVLPKFVNTYPSGPRPTNFGARYRGSATDLSKISGSDDISIDEVRGTKTTWVFYKAVLSHT